MFQAFTHWWSQDSCSDLTKCEEGIVRKLKFLCLLAHVRLPGTLEEIIESHGVVGMEPMESLDADWQKVPMRTHALLDDTV